MILFGIRSPLVVEFEETLKRLGIEITHAVSVSETPRMIDRSAIVELADFTPENGANFLSAAFAPMRRAELIAQARGLGLVLANALIDPHAVVANSVRIGAGTFINASVTIGGASIIGEGVLINRSASIGHHVLLEDNVSIGPGATLAGGIRVGHNSVIGAGATVLPDIRIGSNVIVSGGSVVRKHVPDNSLVVGNPAIAKPFKPRASSLALQGGE